MIAVWRVFRYELRNQGRRPGYLFTSIGLPVLAIVVFFGIQAFQRISQSTPGQASQANQSQSDTGGIGVKSGGLFSSGPVTVGLVDQSGLIGPDVQLGNFKRLPDVYTANAALQSNQINGYILVPSDYLKTGVVQVWAQSFSAVFGSLTTNSIYPLLKTALAVHVKGLDTDTLTRLTEQTPDVINHRLNDTNQLNETAGTGASFILVYFFALALVIVTFLTSGYLMQAVIEERQSRVVEILMSSLRPGDLLAGKVLALGLLGVIQMVIWGAAAYFLVKQLAPTTTALAGLDITVGQLAALLAYFILGYLMFAAVYAGIGAISNSTREGPQFAVFFTLPAMLPLYLSTTFAAQPDSPLAVALSLFPVTSPLAMVMRIAVSPVPIWQIAVSLFLLFLTGIVFMWAAGRLFRVTVLLAGQMPKPSEIPKLLRQSL
ncbi:MAG: ABC transporter permease [Aggregatilineales bacterium]